MAASYSIARPSLSSALAGVAIAAALVPPIASTGISLALDETRNGVGAALLFATNVVAIILGAAINFYAAGVRSSGEFSQGRLWVRRTALGLVLCCAILAVPLGSVLISNLATDRLAPDLPPSTMASLRNHLAGQTPPLALTGAAFRPAPNGDPRERILELRVQSPENFPICRAPPASASSLNSSPSPRSPPRAKGPILEPSLLPARPASYWNLCLMACRTSRSRCEISCLSARP